MSIYSYLLNKEETTYQYPQDRAWWDKVCVWSLRNLYGARYWHDVVLIQAKLMQEYKRKLSEQGVKP